MKKRLIVLMPAVVAAALVWGWYNGMLALIYARFPDLPPIQTVRPNTGLQVILHRGDELYYPENTLPAFRSAIERGPDFIEIDVRLTADEVPVTLHDSTVDRTTDGVGEIRDMTYEEARQLDAGGWFGPQFAGERIPHLSEVLDLAAGKVCVLADLKSSVNYTVVKLLRKFARQAGEGCLYIGFIESLDLEDWGGEIPPDVRASLVQLDQKREQLIASQFAVFNRFWPDFPLARNFEVKDSVEERTERFPNMRLAHLNRGVVDREVIDSLHAKGLRAYTILITREGNAEIDLEAELDAMADAGIDAVMIADSQAMLDFRKKYAAPGGAQSAR